MLNMKYETRKYEIHNTQHTTTTQEPRPKQDFQEFCPGPPGSSQNSLFGSSGPQVLEEVVGSSIPQSRYRLIRHVLGTETHSRPPHTTEIQYTIDAAGVKPMSIATIGISLSEIPSVRKRLREDPTFSGMNCMDTSSSSNSSNSGRRPLKKRKTRYDATPYIFIYL